MFASRRLPSRSACLFAAALLCGSAATWAGPSLDRIKLTGKIVIAHRESSVPFSYVLPDKQPVGYALDLCSRLSEVIRKRLGLAKLQTEYLLVTPATRVAAITDGKADMECGGTTNNAERRQKVAFTVPHYITGTRYMVLANSKIDDLNNFGSRKLVSTVGTTALKSITQNNNERLLGIQILEAPDHAKAVQMVESGEADGFAMDDVLLFGLKASRPEPDKLKVVGKFLTIEPLAIMLPKNDPELKAIVDEEMKRLITSHEADTIYAKWFLQPIPPKQVALNLPMNYLLKDFWKYPTDWVPF
ncbi:amino acid ABC transporter substrate-binding protein [Ideonella azotifigens]|uniref:Amino acid ABC transporter substrate-binding protein n=1 Tax=Ideonella azotifigens TaxID=513160 RepID=A0ABN1KAA0_9BURK|nr:amino acid ABC transporter substrate-binding protein [Ideonella azotifigens]MCD2338922.1 amino acid ABC transporter substrate-binding protein [Ideonella azotifigens]